MVSEATREHLRRVSSSSSSSCSTRQNGDSCTSLKEYFSWPSFLRALVQSTQHDVNGAGQRGHGNKRQRTRRDGSVVYIPLGMTAMKDPSQEEGDEREAWLPLWGYIVSHAYLSLHHSSPHEEEGLSLLIGGNIHETMDRLQNGIVATLPSSLGISRYNIGKRNAVWSGIAACWMDALGEGVVRATLSLREEEDDDVVCGGVGVSGMKQEWTGGCCILGAEVSQIVELLIVPGLLPALASHVHCPLAGLVSETADTLLDYSNVHHRLCHETTTPMADPQHDHHDVLAQLMAKDALHVLQLMDRAYPRLKRELSEKRFTMQTYNYEEENPCKHPIVTFLRALLVTGNLDEGAKLCRALEECDGRLKETERCCWYLLFDKMQEEQVLLEHDWDVVRPATLVPVMDRHGNISTRNIGNITLANIMIGPFGRTVALEYLHGIAVMAKDELFPGYNALMATKSIRSKRDADRDKQYLLAVKDAVRRTVLKFLLPRPHSPAEALDIATRVSEANTPPLLPHHAGPMGGECSSELCCRILGEASLLKLWEEKEAGLVEVPVPEGSTLPAPEVVVHEEESRRVQVQDIGAVANEESVEEDGVMDMSVEIIPPTPAKTPLKSRHSEPVVETHDEIVLGDSEDEEEEAAEEVVEVEEDAYEEDGVNVDVEEVEEECSDEEAYPARVTVDVNKEEELEESVDEEEGHPNDSTTKSPEPSSHDEEVEGEEEENEYYDSNEEYPEESEMNYPRHYQHVPGNYSESDDYDQEDEEEDNRRAAFEGEYDDEEGRGSSRSDGSVEVVDIVSSDNEEDEEGDDDEIPAADVFENESSTEEEGRDETKILNAVVDDYIDAVPEQPPQVEETAEEIMDEAKILHDHVHEFITVASPRKSPEKWNNCLAMMAGKVAVPSEFAAVATTRDEKPDQCFDMKSAEAETMDDMYVEHPPVTDAERSPVENVGTIATEAVSNEVMVTDVIASSAERTNQLDVTPAEDEAEKSDAPYSSDGGNLGGEMSEDMNADDEHESLDTEDDKRSLAEQGETFDEEEIVCVSAVQSHDGSGDEDLDESFEMDQPSVLVAAAMSSQRQGSSYQEVMKNSYRRASLQSFDNTDAALAAPDANLSEYDEASQDGASSFVENNVLVLAQRHGQHLGLTSVLDESIDVVDSDDERQEGGQLTDDGYQPDAEVTEEELVDSKKARTTDDGYVPDAEATEEENTKPIERVGPKVVKKRDVRFETVLETRDTPQRPDPPPVEPASNQSIDEGYLPDGALTEEEKRDREDRRSRHVEEGYLPDGHTTATDDDSAKKRDRRSSHRRAPTAEAEESIDPGYLPSAVEGTEEERSEEESQEAVASLLVAAALGSQKEMSQVGGIAKKSTKSLSTQSIDEGYLPDGFTEEEHGGRSGRGRQRHDVEEGYVPDGHTTPGEATEEDQPGHKPLFLRNAGLKLSKSEPAVNDANQKSQADTTVSCEPLRSEEEDTITDPKDSSNVYTADVAVRETEEESPAIASPVEAAEKQYKSHEDMAVDASDSTKTKVTATEVIHANHHEDIVSHDTRSMHPATGNKTTATTQPIIDSNLLQPINFNPLTLLDDSSKTESHLTEKTKPHNTPAEVGDPDDPDEGGENASHAKPARSSARKTQSYTETLHSHNLPDMSHHVESEIEQENDASVQSETSSRRRSSRLKAKTVPSSPNVPSSITTGRKGAKVPALPAVPEDANLVEEPVIAVVELREKEATEVSSIASRTRRRGKRGAVDNDDASHASSIGEASVASRTRRKGKRGASDDDDSSHAPSVDNEATSRTTTRNKRAKHVDTEAASEAAETVATKRGGGRRKKKPGTVAAAAEAEIKDDLTESASSPSAKTRKDRSKTKDHNVELRAEDDASSVPSPPTRARKGRPPKKAEPVDAEAKDDASATAASPPQTRGGRQKKKNIDSNTESVPSPTRSSRRTRKTTQSEGTSSIASTRPRRSTRSTKH
eukprot:CCRYP_013226-RB/>CCRYP_013226-RB protein AED:0.03 eAED:0.03 QI:950/1/1/1/0.8/0.66/6/2875/1962